MSTTLGVLALVGALITGLGGLALAHVLVRWARSPGDRAAGLAIGVVALAHIAAPSVALFVRAAHPTAARVTSIASLALTALLLLVLPAAISAAGQP